MNPGAAQVLAALRRDPEGPRSGSELSRRLGVSRAQVWKHVETLRGLGYAIEGEPGGGYRLRSAPDRLYAEEIQPGLATRWLARELHHLETTDSTNRVAAELARGGAVHGATVVAESQTAGRGRLGRRFFSPPHLNLYSSSVLRPPLSTAEAPSAILASAVAVAETVADHLDDPGDVEIKWPNDVLIGGRKTSGILVELTAEAARVAWLVLGIGVNLNVGREAFPAEFRALATSLAAHRGRPVERVAFARSLYGTLEEVMDLHAEKGLDALRPRFDAFFRMTGRTVRVEGPGEPAREGVVEGVDAGGALLLGTAGGTERVLAGDVTVAKAGAAS